MRRWFTHGFVGVVMALMMVAVGSTAVHADPRDFSLRNDHPINIIEEIYVSPSNQTEWGDDVLGQDILEPGQQVNISFQRFIPGDCLYDIKIVLDNGAEQGIDQINLCETTLVTYS